MIVRVKPRLAENRREGMLMRQERKEFDGALQIKEKECRDQKRKKVVRSPKERKKNKSIWKLNDLYQPPNKKKNKNVMP